MASDIFNKARDFGHQMLGRRAVLPLFALEVARAARAGEIDKGNANELYFQYQSVVKRGEKVEIAKSGPRVQASKLRQIIKLATSAKVHDPVAFLESVLELHFDLSRKEKVKPAYVAMVEVARLQMLSSRQLSKEQIKQIIRQ